MALTFHTRSAEIFGAAFSDIYLSHPNASEVLSEIDALRHDYRRRGASIVVNLVWQMAGGVGEPPEDLTLAFALNLSVFTTQALMADFDKTPAQIGALTADILKTLLQRAVQAQRSAGPMSPPVPMAARVDRTKRGTRRVVPLCIESARVSWRLGCL